MKTYFLYLMLFATICASCLKIPGSQILTESSSSSLKPYTSFATTKPLIGFNWSNSKLEFQEFATRAAQEGKEKNARVSSPEDLPQFAQRAFGLYIANDPYLSRSFGNLLSCINIKANTLVIPPDVSSPPPADILWYVKNPAALSLYDYSKGLVPINLRGDVSAVVRDSAAIDFSKSARISFEIDKEQDKLNAEQLKLGTDMLASQNPCAAFAAFESNEVLMIKSMLASVDLNSLKTQKTDPIRMIVDVYLKSRTGPSALLVDASKRLLKNTSLLDKLFKAKILKNKNDEKSITAVLGAVLFDPGDVIEELDDISNETFSLIVQLINSTDIIHVDENTNNLRALNEAMTNAFAHAHELWASSHVAEVGFMKQLWQKSMEQSLSTFLVEQGFSLR